MPKATDPSFTMAMAMLAVKSGMSLTAPKLAAAWKACWPDAPLLAELKGGEGLTCKVGEMFVVIGVMPKPVPADDIDAACSMSWMWPEAKQAMAEHDAHMIVTVLGRDEPVIECNLVLTRIMAALIGASDAAGVYWGNASMVIEPERFVADAKEAVGDGSLPLTLWVNILVSQSRGRTTATTRGLESLGHKEFEVIESKIDPDEVLDFVGGVCGYVLENGAMLEHGETIGMSETQKVKIEHRRSKFTPGKEVIGLKV